MKKNYSYSAFFVFLAAAFLGAAAFLAAFSAFCVAVFATLGVEVFAPAALVDFLRGLLTP